ncbi:MAG: PQQ-binding-like beta-propeller repeat protein [Acidimicrobiia bacterium]|nr:PQQ-binding-like beta-propeller repeat protein [Acidimicrobiia bacterium]
MRLSPPRWLVLCLLAVAACSPSLGGDGPVAADGATTPETLPPVTAIRGQTTTSLPPVTTTAPPTTTTTAPPGGVGASYGTVTGLTMFRGNPSRTWYGEGPIPDSLAVRWRFPAEPMCGNSPVGGADKVWCGNGWTGQPVVWERPDGVTEVIFGAYDKNIHFLDAATGERTRPDFFMGDIIKGSVTLDPEGHPLLYAGSRDPAFRIIALDRETPTELWRLDAASVDGMWNNDWDSNPVVVDDMLYVGGENSWWFAIDLNRGTDGDGLVTVDPEVVFSMPAFTDELLGAVGRQQSVESSTAVFEDRAYFANSAGRVVGVDIGALPDGDAAVVFDYWMGDDVDATIVIDGAGDLYVAAQVDLVTSRAGDVGQLVKLDPDNPDDPRVWGLEVPAGGVDGGIWATPALVGDLLFVPTNVGELLAVDTATGEVVWRDDIGLHAWSSAVHAGDRLLVSTDCENEAALRVYDVSDPRAPVRLSDNVFAGGCIEATPAVWKGGVYVGSRDGYFYGLEAG